MANCLGRMPLAPEMNPFQAEIGGNQRLVTRRDLQDGAIISDTSCNRSPSGSPTPNTRDQQFFGVRQDAPMYPDNLIYKEGTLRQDSDV
jgi:hypothetical protein